VFPFELFERLPENGHLAGFLDENADPGIGECTTYGITAGREPSGPLAQIETLQAESPQMYLRKLRERTTARQGRAFALPMEMIYSPRCCGACWVKGGAFGA